MPHFAKPNDVILHYDVKAGDKVRRPVVFLNSLGTDFRIWDRVVDDLPETPCLLLDKRGHGLSGSGAISIDVLADDVADLMRVLGWTGAIVCGVSVGGMIAQSLAHRCPDLVAGLVLCNTGAKIGTAAIWNDRVGKVLGPGIEAIADDILDRWFSPHYRTGFPVSVAGYRNMLTRIPADDYAATCAAIRDRDLTDTTKLIGIPTVCIAGADDLATPPDLVLELSGLIAGSQVHILPDVGHLPCIEAPEFVATQIRSLQGRLS